jgi:hypothetical protein
LFSVLKNYFRKQFAKHFFNEKTTENDFFVFVLENNSQTQKQKPVCQTSSKSRTKQAGEGLTLTVKDCQKQSEDPSKRKCEYWNFPAFE